MMNGPTLRRTPVVPSSTNVPGLRINSGVSYAAAKALEHLKKGIGQSKRCYRKAYGRSPLIHAYKTLSRYAGIFNNFKDTVLIPGGGNKLRKITTGHIDRHFGNLIEDGASEKTIAVNASALNKFFHAFGRYDLVEYINETRAAWRESAVPSSRTEPFVDPERVILSMRSPYHAGAVIQYLTGARVADIRKVCEWVHRNPCSTEIRILKSKGGKDRVIYFPERLHHLERIREAVRILGGGDIDWPAFLKAYTKEVKASAKKNREIYTGPHAFRVNYANNRYEELALRSMNSREEEETLITITEELGHSRISMAKYYIPAFRQS
ncbi:MAG: hypothetical protein PHC68_05525 [Syntrophorhabdaceae bacterium]|nr:hypothetical protein [Syntrophorhabdaceae bacterium]